MIQLVQTILRKLTSILIGLVRIYENMMRGSTLQAVHVAPLTLRVDSIFAVLSRLEPPSKQGMGLIDKLRLYDGEMVAPYDRQSRAAMQRHHPAEGMSGISPRYVMNRLGSVASMPDVTCITPLAALDSLWRGLHQNVSLGEIDAPKWVSFVSETIREYNNLAVKEIQRAYEESFEETANRLLDSYLDSVAAYLDPSNEVGGEGPALMKELERSISIAERSKDSFRREMHELAAVQRDMGSKLVYTTEPRLQTAIEARLLLPRRKLERGLTEPRFARQKVVWAQRRESIMERLKNNYGYCHTCAQDLIEYVTFVLKGNVTAKTPKNEEVEWQWPLSDSSSANIGAD